MPSGIGYGAAEGLQEVLQRMFLQAQFNQQKTMDEAKLAETIRQANMGQEIAQGQLGQGQQRIDLGRDELGLSRDKFTEDTRQFDATAPVRAADVEYKGALTGELLRKPEAEATDRAFTTTRDKTLHGYRLGEIGARSADSVAGDWQIVQSVNPQTNETVSVRVNRQTGEAQPVSMPSGLQPGGARQTRLSAGQQDDLSTMDVVQQLGQQALQLGDRINWEGVGGMGSGTMRQFVMKNFGVGNPKAEELRNLIGNVQGTIAKLRGGTAFSAQEKAMLDSYTPTINDSAPQIKAKLSQLNNFITLKRDATLKYAGAPAAPGAATPADDAASRAQALISKYRGGGQ